MADLRVVTAARPGDPGLARPVVELLAAIKEFARLWESHEVTVRRAATKRLLHPTVGLLELDCEILLNSGDSQLLLVHTARAGTDSYERLQLLRMLGTQNLSPSPGTKFGHFRQPVNDPGMDSRACSS